MVAAPKVNAGTLVGFGESVFLAARLGALMRRPIAVPVRWGDEGLVVACQAGDTAVTPGDTASLSPDPSNYCILLE